MSFAYPHAFFLMPLVVLFMVVAFYNYKKKLKILADFVSPEAYDKLGTRSGREIDFFKALLITVSFILFIFALAGPRWGEKFAQVDIKGIEICFLLDTSTSMHAEDLKPNRLEVAKNLVSGIVDNLETDYVALINFAAVPYVQCPLTSDYGAFKMLVEATECSPAEEQGTDFGKALALAVKTFESSKSEQKLLLLITDGEDQEGGWNQWVDALKEAKISAFTVGVGAPSGAPIPVKDESGNVTGWKKDRQGNIVKTRLDENTLIQVASRLDGRYFRLTDPAGVDEFIENLKGFERSVLHQKVKVEKKHRYYFFLIPGLLLLLLETILSERKLKWIKK